MPMIGGKPNRKLVFGTGRIKRLAALAFLLTLLIGVGDRLGWLPGTSAQRGRQVARQVSNPEVTATDCSFLQAPENFKGVQARHRASISAATDAISKRLTGAEGSALMAAQDVPRRTVIDNILFEKMAVDQVPSAPLSSDEEFLRRVYLDLTGRIPNASDLESFVKSTDVNKRDAVIDRLLDSPEFVDKWAQFYGDLFKNTFTATNITRYIGGREAFHKYLRDSLDENKSYAQMASEMIAANGDSYLDGATNFVVGWNVPMGPAQDTMDGAAVQVATAFLGLSSMDCLLCHDGAGHLDAINLWGAKVTRWDAWGMASFFARVRRQQVTINQNPFYAKYTISENATGEYQLNTNSGNRQTRAPINGRNTVAPKYLYGTETVGASENRRQALARILTTDPQFARAAVNYIWEELMVEALVSPSNSFDLARLDPNAQMPDGWALQPANAELLEALAQEFRSTGYNLRYIIGLIVKSNAYQLSSRYPGTWKLEYVPYYARKFARRLDAEELHDAIIKATGQPPVTTYRDAATNQNVTILGYPILNEANQKIGEAQWASQLSDPLEPRSNGTSRVFLDSFLRGNRDSNLRSSDSSILQALNMMNNTFVTSRIHQGNRITTIPNTPEIPSTVRRLLADTSLSNEQIVTQLYLNTLSRYPTQAEMDKLKPYFTSQGKTAATESIQWVLLNKVDFLFNY
ncbi:MAG: DUF1553 domain-containing protein [Acidobacteria bacterium]|nr:DUF1553 domain-containing protein [Acidobacteriota bacterium]